VKAFITVVTLAALTATSAVARTPRVKAIHDDGRNIYQSYAQGNQTFPNPDRDFETFRDYDF
jgi:hypothetical protein